jgi:hypothetical protein
MRAAGVRQIGGGEALAQARHGAHGAAIVLRAGRDGDGPSPILG